MKQFMEFYGSTVVAVVVGLAILVCFSQISFQGKKGTAAMMGLLLENELKPLAPAEENQVFSEYMDVEIPMPTVGDSYVCSAGELVHWKELISLNGAETERAGVQIIGLWDMDMIPVACELTENAEKIRLQSPGLYRVGLRIATEGGRFRVILVKIIVNERKIL